MQLLRLLTVSVCFIPHVVTAVGSRSWADAQLERFVTVSVETIKHDYHDSHAIQGAWN